MHRDRFSLETILYLIVGLVFLFIFINYYDSAFPTASIDLKITRDEAKQKAEEFLKAKGYDLSEFENATIFGANQSAAVFLEKTQGMEKANEMMRSEKIYQSYVSGPSYPSRDLGFRAFNVSSLSRICSWD